MCSKDIIGTKSPLMMLPNELFLDVASYLKRFEDFNSLVRTTRFFHRMLNRHLYRRAVATDHHVRNYIVCSALSGYHLASLTLLLDNGLSVNHTVQWNLWANEETMLRFLCKSPGQERSVPLARLLIQRGADIEAKDDRYPYTVLCEAISHLNYEIAALLLAHGADPNAVIKWRDTPLNFAIKTSDARMVNLLVTHGAAVDGRDGYGNTPLLLALQCLNCSVVPVLLAHGADAGAHNKGGTTPLHEASIWFDSDHHELAESLLAHGAVVSAIDDSGLTPLHWASLAPQNRGFFMAKFLLQNGADIDAISERGRSPLQEALSRNNQSVATLLLTHGANVGALDGREKGICQRIVEGMGIEHHSLCPAFAIARRIDIWIGVGGRNGAGSERSRVGAGAEQEREGERKWSETGVE
jgi:ankyrin repeat protein